MTESHEDPKPLPLEDGHEKQDADAPADAEHVKNDALALADDKGETSTDSHEDPESPAEPTGPRKPIEHWAEKHHGLTPHKHEEHELHVDTGRMTGGDGMAGFLRLAVYNGTKAHAGWASHREVTEDEFHAATAAFKNITCS